MKVFYLIVLSVLTLSLGSFALIRGEIIDTEFLEGTFLEGIVSAGSVEDIEITYKDSNMTIEFKDGTSVVGEATLKSHATYDEVLEVVTGKNKTVIWYEFSDFKDIQLDALKGVEFIDMREMISNKSYIKLFDGDIEKMNESLILIKNPDYLLPIEKDYKFVFQDDKGNWLDYNSFDIPKENIIIGVQTDLFWGEFIDVRFNIFDNSLDKHAVTRGVNAGFVTVSPTADPDLYGSQIDDKSLVVKDTSPSGAIKITEIGWWCSSATEAANFEVGLYAANGATVPGEAGTRLYVDDTNAKGTTAGWKKVAVDWEIDAETIYWIGIQVDDTDSITYVEYDSTSTTSYDLKSSQTSLTNPYGGGAFTTYSYVHAIYAVWEEAAEPEDCWVVEDWGIFVPDDCVYEIPSGEVG